MYKLTHEFSHDEFAPYMYARPRLMLDDDAVLLRFLETADGERLRHFVRKLSVAYLVPESPTVGSHKSPHAARLGDWIRSWQGIALMEGLKHLQVTVVARGAFANRSYEARVLGPLMLLRGRKKEDGKGGKLETFEVMSFEGTRECGLPAGLENAPFKYIWRAWMLLGGPELEVSDPDAENTCMSRRLTRCFTESGTSPEEVCGCPASILAPLVVV